MGIAVSCGRDVERELFSAIREGDLQLIKALLNEKPKLVNGALSHTRLSPLHYAASYGQPDVLILLLERGAQLNALNHHKQTPLMLACKNGRLVCIDRLLERGADILMFDSLNGRTCLHYAAKSGHLNCLQRILGAGQLSPVAETWGFARFVNVRDAIGATPLHLAARSSNPAVVRLLLDNGALVCATTTSPAGRSGSIFGSTPLHFAGRGGSTECVRVLLAWGADRNQRDSQGHTPYFVAMKYKNAACAALLNPHVAEPLVWPISWKFMSDLDPEAKSLLEAALVEANNAREKMTYTLGSEDIVTASEAVLTGEISGVIEDEEDEDDEDNEVCCICFEHACTIEVQDCGHQMCAGCTLALCCHNKPNPAMPNSPPPACPFCRRNIGQLRLARPKEIVVEMEVDNKGANNLKKVGEGSSSFIGIVGKGSFRLLSGRGSGKVADMDWLKECSSQDLCSSH